ncbi:tigger transposable element-derived protein 6-like protein [Plakobranchus ocellatus]|uniref:Tigger transposable element-derived protein 6-like protein n=1 Tax=Plakobranchus ocellatus TaxID=259542 RepID=A0AAV4BGM3_9GAST|nr:tigger transposable element-derived protein 6-like protein [Plakobranchus ocellatus]
MVNKFTCHRRWEKWDNEIMKKTKNVKWFLYVINYFLFAEDSIPPSVYKFLEAIEVIWKSDIKKLTMPQYYKHKTETEHPTEGRIVAALDAVANGLTLHKAADEFGISKNALQRYQAKQAKQKNDASALSETPLAPNYQHAKIFSAAQEQELMQFIAEVSDMFHGYTYKQLRVFAYEMAVSNKIKIPRYWQENKMASSDWQKGFMARNGERLALRTAEPTSLARTTAFNRFNVETFFNNLETCYLKAKSTACTIYNLDETGCTTTHKPPKVLARKGCKQVGKVVSQERGELVTVCAIVSAAGVCIPPVLVFPRKNYKDIFMRGGPEEALGLVNPSGWMNIDLFLNVLKHFVKHARPAIDHQVVLVMDNHESHVSLAAREYAKENNIHIVTLPPHTSHRTQPLDRTVFGPMKIFLNSACDSWCLANPGRAISIYMTWQG